MIAIGCDWYSVETYDAVPDAIVAVQPPPDESARSPSNFQCRIVLVPSDVTGGLEPNGTRVLCTRKNPTSTAAIPTPVTPSFVSAWSVMANCCWYKGFPR